MVADTSTNSRTYGVYIVSLSNGEKDDFCGSEGEFDELCGKKMVAVKCRKIIRLFDATPGEQLW